MGTDHFFCLDAKEAKDQGQKLRVSGVVVKRYKRLRNSSEESRFAWILPRQTSSAGVACSFHEQLAVTLRMAGEHGAVYYLCMRLFLSSIAVSSEQLAAFVELVGKKPKH